MYLAVLKLFWLIRQGIDWIRIHALRYFGHEIVQGGHGNRGARAGKLPLSDWRYPLSVVLALIEALLRMVWQVVRWLFFLNTRSVPEFLLSVVKLVLVLSVLSVVGLYGYLSGEPDSEVLAEYQRLHQQHTATTLLDQQGQLVGAMPNPQRQSQSLGGLFIELVPPVYWDVLDEQTGRQVSFDYQETSLWDLLFLRETSYKGIATADIVAAFNPFATGSNSLMKRLNNALLSVEQPESRCFSWFSDLCNTFSAIRLAKHTFPYLAQNNGSEFKRWVAIHNSLRGQADDFNGLRATAATVFHKLPEQLSNAEQSLLAVAQLKQQALLNVDNWEALTSEAAAVTQSLYQRDQNALASEIKQGLAALKQPRVTALNDVSRPPPRAILNLANLRKRTARALGEFADLVQQRLAAEYSRSDGLLLISDAQISLPVRDNLVFQQKLQDRLRAFARGCRHCGLRQTLGAAAAKPESGATVQVLVADQAGKLVRYYKQGQIKDRSVGQLSTIPAAVLLASKGNSADTRFCNQTYRNLPSSVKGFPRGVANCDTPQQAGHSLSFAASTQLRESLPLFTALRTQATSGELMKLYADFALKDLRTRQGKTTHAEQLVYEMSYGIVQSTPLQMLEINYQLGEILYGKGDPKALQSTSQFLVSNIQQQRRYLEFSEAPSAVRLRGHYLRTQASKDTLKQLLSLEMQAGTGRLRTLRNIKNIRFLSTKTGQTYTKQQAVRDQWLLANVLIRGKRYSISAFVGSAADDPRGLAEQLSVAGMFYTIVSEIADSLD
ncbi:MAG: hypothetical protein CSB47_10055 [Proteobacteria bacterium]|nr:MAG: hypothetical protein CSB47_10055 [Pseudomonadota bacterium]